MDKQAQAVVRATITWQSGQGGGAPPPQPMPAAGGCWQGLCVRVCVCVPSTGSGVAVGAKAELIQ